MPTYIAECEMSKMFISALPSYLIVLNCFGRSSRPQGCLIGLSQWPHQGQGRSTLATLMIFVRAGMTTQILYIKKMRKEKRKKQTRYFRENQPGNWIMRKQSGSREKKYWKRSKKIDIWEEQSEDNQTPEIRQQVLTQAKRSYSMLRNISRLFIRANSCKNELV